MRVFLKEKRVNLQITCGKPAAVRGAIEDNFYFTFDSPLEFFFDVLSLREA